MCTNLIMILFKCYNYQEYEKSDFIIIVSSDKVQQTVI